MSSSSLARARRLFGLLLLCQAGCNFSFNPDVEHSDDERDATMSDDPPVETAPREAEVLQDTGPPSVPPDDAALSCESGCSHLLCDAGCDAGSCDEDACVESCTPCDVLGPLR